MTNYDEEEIRNKEEQEEVVSLIDERQAHFSRMETEEKAFSASSSSSKKRKQMLKEQREEYDAEIQKLKEGSDKKDNTFKRPKDNIIMGPATSTTPQTFLGGQKKRPFGLPPVRVKLEDCMITQLPKFRVKVCRKISQILSREFGYRKGEAHKLALAVERRVNIFHSSDSKAYLECVKGIFKHINRDSTKMGQLSSVLSRDVSIFGKETNLTLQDNSSYIGDF